MHNADGPHTSGDKEEIKGQRNNFLFKFFLVL